MRSRHPVGILATLIVAGACTLVDAVGADESTPDETVQDRIRITLTVRPDVLDPPGTVTAVLTYENLSTERVVLSSAYGCLSFASVYLNEERIPFPSTQYYCTAAITRHHLASRARLKQEWPLVVGGESGINVRAGTYRFVAELNTPGGKLERTFVIR